MPDKSHSHGRLKLEPNLKPRAFVNELQPLHGVWRAKVITLFPEAFPGVLGLSLTGQALTQGLWTLDTINLRDFGLTKHRNVDAPPAGGGPGMVIRADVLGPAVEVAQRDVKPGHRLIYLSPRGTPFTQAMASTFAQGPGVTLICGRFEGVDDRVLTHYGVEEISIGDYVLSGGEIAAQAVIDASLRLIPHVLGNQASTQDESFSKGLVEYPQYTKPAVWAGHSVPDVLLSGDHAKIARWRQETAEKLTKSRRPDLWEAYHRSKC